MARSYLTCLTGLYLAFILSLFLLTAAHRSLLTFCRSDVVRKLSFTYLEKNSLKLENVSLLNIRLTSA